MGTRQHTVDFILDHLADAGSVTARKMFGEYALYYDGKTVALVCDDALFVKPTKAGETHLGVVTYGIPFPGAKPWFSITADRWEDAEWLSQLIRQTADALPQPAPKKPKTKPHSKKSARRA